MPDTEELPQGWVKKISRTNGQPYYYNQTTGESKWELPKFDAANQESRIRASHLLRKHQGSRKPVNWRGQEITRTKEEAIEELNKYIDMIKGGEKTFEDLATEFSDCSSAKRQGDLGMFGRGAMQAPFEEAAFELDVGQLSGIVDTDSGVHIIKRTA